MIFEKITIQTAEKYEKQIKSYLIDVLMENKIENTNQKVEEIYQNMKEYIQDGTAIIIGAIQEEKLNGFIWGYLRKSDEKARAHINYFVVNKDIRGQGIGQGLIREFYKEIEEKNINEIELMVTCSNKRAMNFYEKQGFNEERVLLWKRL